MQDNNAYLAVFCLKPAAEPSRCVWRDIQEGTCVKITKRFRARNKPHLMFPTFEDAETSDYDITLRNLQHRKVTRRLTRGLPCAASLITTERRCIPIYTPKTTKVSSTTTILRHLYTEHHTKAAKKSWRSSTSVTHAASSTRQLAGATKRNTMSTCACVPRDWSGRS